MGHSLGGWTAGIYAIENPHRIGRLVLVDAAGLTKLTAGEIDDLKRSLSPTDRRGARHLFDLLFFRPPARPGGYLLSGLARSFNDDNVTVTVESLTEADALLGREERLPPGTVFIWGAEELLFPVADARRAAARVPSSRLLVLTGVGHDPPVEAAALFRRALLGVLDESASAQP